MGFTAMADINLETTPADVRFPNVNQARHCYMRYNEFFRCQAKHGEGADECAKMQKFYMSICPAEWTERWNERRERVLCAARYAILRCFGLGPLQNDSASCFQSRLGRDRGPWKTHSRLFATIHPF